MPELKMKRITEAKLIINGNAVDWLEFNSTEMSKKELELEISKRFLKKLVFSYNEEWVKK